MTHREKVELALSDLTARGVRRRTVAPPVFRLLWKIGIDVPPPLFMSFDTLVVFAAAPSAIIFWLYHAMFYEPGHPVAVFLVCVAEGLVIGLIMAVSFRRKASKLQLPAWGNYPSRGAVGSKQGETC